MRVNSIKKNLKVDTIRGKKKHENQRQKNSYGRKNFNEQKRKINCS